VTTLDGLGLATLIARPGTGPSLAPELGFSLPSAPAVAGTAALSALWAGPDQWLLRGTDRARLDATLVRLMPLAAVSEQSDARAVLRISGPSARDVLAKGCLLDLHPRAFPVRATALSMIAHMGVQLWRDEDEADGPTFELLLARSMAGSFWSWLSASAAEFGCAVTAGRG